MKLSKLALLATFACGIQAGSAMAQETFTSSFGQIAQVGCFDNDCCEPECGCETDCCEIGCDDSGCDGRGAASSCCGTPGTLLGDGTMPSLCIKDCGCDPWQLCGSHWGRDKGGWLQIGYHSAGRNGLNFNDHPDQINLHQAWFYMERVADGSCGIDFGGRVDYVYGVDAQNTQAFGLDNGHWDNDWDNGIYGHAIPQLYGEVAYGDLSMKVGHFYTIIGYEVVTAPDNFFYSHAWTMNNSEPFTHTGALASYACGDETTVFGGWTMGWDSGFEDNGDSLLAGVSRDLTDSMNLTVAYTGGRFNEQFGARPAETGNMFSVVLQNSCGDNLNYVLQYDYLDTDTPGGMTARNTHSVNQYLIYNICDCLAVGTRLEWWNVEGSTFGLAAGDNHDIYDLTFGVNYRGNPNWIIRPEVRFTKHNDAVRNPGVFAVNENGAKTQTTFGIDGIFTF